VKWAVETADKSRLPPSDPLGLSERVFFCRGGLAREANSVSTDELAEAAFAGSDSLGAGPDIARSPWVVMKFGGSSVTTASNWQTIDRLLQKRLRDGLRPVLVQSALQGVSNALTRMAHEAAKAMPAKELEGLWKKHAKLADSLGLTDIQRARKHTETDS
jgi:hypothetical protein